MNLHENKELFGDAVIATSQLKGIAEIYFATFVEKTCTYK